MEKPDPTMTYAEWEVLRRIISLYVQEDKHDNPRKSSTERQTRSSTSTAGSRFGQLMKTAEGRARLAAQLARARAARARHGHS